MARKTQFPPSDVPIDDKKLADSKRKPLETGK
jgi:hypothetical protein